MENATKYDEIVDMLNASYTDLTVSDFSNIKKMVAELSAEKVGESKTANVKAFENDVRAGDQVMFTYKDAPMTGEVVKVNPKTFTARFSVDGAFVNRAINFSKFLKKMTSDEKLEKVA